MVRLVVERLFDYCDCCVVYGLICGVLVGGLLIVLVVAIYFGLFVCLCFCVFVALALGLFVLIFGCLFNYVVFPWWFEYCECCRFLWIDVALLFCCFWV